MSIAELGEILGRVLGRGVDVRGVVPLAGVSHRSFRVNTDRGVFAVKLRERGAAAVLGLEDEYRVHERVAAAGLAPAPVGYDAAARALVTAYLEGAEALTAERIRERGTLLELAALLDALHAVPAGALGPFAAEAHARRYVEAVPRRLALDPAGAALAAELVELGAEFDARAAERVLCHADLVASNVLDSGRLTLVDFEYAAASDPVLDLASLAAMNGLGPAERNALVRAYSAHGKPWATADFDKVVRLLELLAYFWAEAEAARTGPRAALSEYRRRDRLLNRDEQ